ncbi:MAG: O-antigen ligase family protein, partial [Cetobacterium sp.]|uniref:O-antigen ligase family protein n=1 Tax=Cetobacterium sp. TaxID=2071632 RepID=UPI003EE66725
LYIFLIIGILWGIKQYIFLDNFEKKYINSYLNYTYWRGQIRPIGSYSDTPQYASMCLIGFLLALRDYFIKRRFKKSICLLSLSFIGILLSLSRSNWLATIITIVVIVPIKYLLLIVPAVFFLADGNLIMDRLNTFKIQEKGIRDAGILHRFDLWKKYLEENISAFGNGIGKSTFISLDVKNFFSQVDSGYFKYLNEIGILGAIFLFLLIIIMLKKSYKIKKKNPFYLVLILSFFILNIFGQPLDGNPYNFYFFYFIGKLQRTKIIKNKKGVIQNE